ncbi:hypothetical protein EG831_02450 [bacterium]|nr:hypothetical protein [bacterium]
MKLNRYFLLGTLLLLGVGLVLGGCGRKDNPFEPNSSTGQSSVGANLMPTSSITIDPGAGTQITDWDNLAPGVQCQIIIDFAEEMNPGTVTPANIQLAVYNPLGNEITGDTLRYYNEINRAVIKASLALNKRYYLTLKPGLLTRGGRQIDGNGNLRFDGTPYDDHIHYFYTGAPAASERIPDLVHPVLTDWSPATGSYTGTDFDIRLQFNAGDFDTTSVKTNITVRDSLGNPVAISSAGVSGNWMLFTGTNPAPGADTMRYGMRYTVTVEVNDITDSMSAYGKNKASWSNYGYIANVPNLVWSFRRRNVEPSGANVSPVQYSSFLTDGPNAYEVNFDDTLDYSTINTSTVKLYKTSGSTITGMVDFTIYYDPQDVNWGRFHITAENLVAGQTYRLWVSRFIRDKYGWYLDGNGNGIGGEAGDGRLGINPDDVEINFTR